MMLDPASLDQAVRAGDGDAVRALLRDATEAERRACAKALASLLTGPAFPMPQPVMFTSLADGIGFIFEKMAQASAGIRDQPPAGPEERTYSAWRDMSQTAAFVAAAVGLAGGRGQAEKVLEEHLSAHEMTGEGYDVIAGVLADRNPQWLADLVNRGLTLPPFMGGLNDWPLARRLVRLGAIGRPEVAEYTTKMPGGLSPVRWGDAARSVLDGLLDDPSLLDDEVWRLFTVPGAARQAQYSEKEWEDALAVLAERGLLDRGRLLDECLDAFVRDFPPNSVGWYLALHDRLAPGTAEIAARRGRYLALLAAANKPGVTLGQRCCGTLLDAGLLPAPAFLAACGPALAFPQKSVATAQLKLIAKVAAEQPSARDLALATAAQAFGHMREDIQLAALKLIARYGLPADPAARASIIAQAEALSPVLAPDAAALGVVSAPAPGVAARDRVEAPALGEPVALLPVTDPAELIQLLAQLMEDASDAVAIERALAGAVRLASRPLGERARLAAPLLKRAASQARADYDGPFSGHIVRADMAWLTQTWATGQPPGEREHRAWGVEDREEVLRSGTARTMAGIFSARAWEACTLIAAGDSGPLLAEPEFTDGTIGHAVLLDRLARAGGTRRPRHDLEVAMLRLAPGAGDDYWERWFRLDPRSMPAARGAYRCAAAPLEFEPVAHEVERESSHGLPLTELIPTVAARLTSEVPAGSGDPPSRCWRLLTNLDHPVHGAHGRHAMSNLRMDEIVAAWPLLCPHQPELIAAHLLRPLTDGLVPGPSAASVAVSGIGIAGRPIAAIGHLAIAAGLASAEPDARISAAAVWNRAACDGRLDPALAASVIALGIHGRVFKPNRLADALQHALLDPAAAQCAAAACTAAVAAALAARPPRPPGPPGLHLLLETAARAMTTAPDPGAIAVPPAIAALAASRDRTKLADSARHLTRLTKLPPSAAPSPVRARPLPPLGRLPLSQQPLVFTLHTI